MGESVGKVLITRKDNNVPEEKEQVVFHLWENVGSDQGRRVSDKPLIGDNTGTMIGPNNPRSGSIDLQIAEDLIVSAGGPREVTQSISMEEQLDILHRMERNAETVSIRARSLEGLRVIEEAVIRNLNTRDEGRADNAGITATLEFREILRAQVEEGLEIRIPALEDPALSDTDGEDDCATEEEVAKALTAGVRPIATSSPVVEPGLALVECRSGPGTGHGEPRCIALPTKVDQAAETITNTLGQAAGGIADTFGKAMDGAAKLFEDPFFDPTEPTIKSEPGPIQKHMGSEANIISSSQLREQGDTGEFILKQLLNWDRETQIDGFVSELGRPVTSFSYKTESATMDTFKNASNEEVSALAVGGLAAAGAVGAAPIGAIVLVDVSKHNDKETDIYWRRQDVVAAAKKFDITTKVGTC